MDRNLSHNRDPFSYVPRTFNRGNNIDSHELLKQQLARDPKGDDAYKFNTKPPSEDANNPSQVGFEDSDLLFDSVNRNTSSDQTPGELSWSIPAFNNTNDIRNCIGITISPFYFPNVYSSANHPDFLYYRRMYMEITTVPATQAVQTTMGNKFHFEFAVNNTTGQAVSLTPLRDNFYFQKPINNITDFTVRFHTVGNASPNGFRRVPIPKDRMTVVSSPTNPIQFTITSGELTTGQLGPIGIPTTPGIAVFITGYNSGSASLNTLVNDPEGLYVTNIIDATTFEIGSIDGTPSATPFPATTYIPKNRIELPVRFTTIKNQNTNFITITHQ